MDCRYCAPEVTQATILFVAGTDFCGKVGSWEVCDRHLPSLKQALQFGYDSCTPAHRYSIGFVTDLDTGEETRWEIEQLGEYTIDRLIEFFEPVTVSCEGCGRVCGSAGEAARCNTQHAAEAQQAAETLAAKEKQQQRAEFMWRKKLQEQADIKCIKCHRVIGWSGGVMCDDCLRLDRVNKWWRRTGGKTSGS